MKKLLFFLSALFALLLTACTDDQISNVIDRVDPTPPVAVEDITALFGDGTVSVSTTGNLLAKAKSRGAVSRASTTLANYATPASFASNAGAVNNPYTFQSAPSVPEDAIDLNSLDPYGWPTGSFLESGKNYVINNDFNLYIQKKFAEGDVDGTINVYIAPGVTLDGNPNIEYGPARVKYYICEGATWNCTTNPLEIHNWGTLNLTNGLSQCAAGSDGMVVGYDSNWQPILSKATQRLYNYATLNCSGTVQIEGNFYSSTDVSAILNGKGNIYVDGNLNAESGFGLSGKLYVKGEMSGDININIGLAAHVGSINTTGQVTLTSASQLMVEGDVTAASMKLDGGEWKDNKYVPSEFVVKGTANVSGGVNIASSTKGYFEKLICNNYTAAASDIWVGCSTSVSEDLTFKGDAKMTLANGVYVHAKNLTVSSSLLMTMHAKSFLQIDNKIQLNNANDNKFEGVDEGAENLAIIQSKTLGANYENFENTFVGNVGIEFEGWDYDSSTGLIDKNTNLQRLHEVAANVNYENTDCSPGYQGVNVRGENPGGGNTEVKTPIGYAVYYVYRDNGNSAADAMVVQPGDGHYVGDVVTEYPVDIDGFEAHASELTITLGEVQSDNVMIFYYDAIPNDPVLADCTVMFVDVNGVAVAPFYTIQQYVGNWVYADALEIAGYELNGESHKVREMTGDNDVITFIYRQLGDAPIINNNPVNPPSPDIIPDVPFTSDDLNIALESTVQGEWIIQADDFAIHNGDILYVSIADTSDKRGHSAYNNFVEVNPSDNVTISLANIDDIYNAYKGKTTTCTDTKSPYYGQAVPYINQINGMLTLEVYLWPAKKDGASIVPIPPTEFLNITADGIDGKYLIGTEDGPRVYANDKYFVQVSAYASYNGGGNGADMTSYVKVSFHISPRP